jgi:hypothetical protein
VSDTLAYNEYSVFAGTSLLNTEDPPSTDMQSKHVSFIYTSLKRPPPTAPGNNEKDYDPRLVVTCPAVANIARLKITHFRTALLLRVARLWVLQRVLPAMVQQQHDSSEKEYPGDKEKIHTSCVMWLNNTQQTSMQFNTVYFKDDISLRIVCRF